MAPSVKANGGRPRVQIDAGAIMELRSAGRSWRAIEKLTGASARTARRAVRDFSPMRGKTPETPVAKPILGASEASPEPLQRRDRPTGLVAGFWERQAIIQDAHDILDEPETPTVCRRLERFAFEVGRALKPIEQPEKPMLQEQGMGDEFSA